MHWILKGAAKQEAQPSLATYSREDSTSGDLPTVGSGHISCNAEPTVLARAIGNRLRLDRRRESHHMSLLLSYKWNMIQ